MARALPRHYPWPHEARPHRPRRTRLRRVGAAARGTCAGGRRRNCRRPTAAATAPLAGAALLAALRDGGYVLYLRHTSTDFGENDSRMTDYANCATQRNLTDGGRAEARAIGAALKALAIPVGRVLASPYCRTLETGRLVFGTATPSPAVRGGPARPDNPDRYAELRALLGTPVPRGHQRRHREPRQSVLRRGRAALPRGGRNGGRRAAGRRPVPHRRARPEG